MLITTVSVNAFSYTNYFVSDGIIYAVRSYGVLRVIGYNSNAYAGDDDYGHYAGDVVIPDSVQHEGTMLPVTEIDYAAFRGSAELTSVTIPRGVTEIGKIAFDECPVLRQITVHPDNAAYCDVDGVLYTKDMTCLMALPTAIEGTYAVPAGVTVIAENGVCGSNLSGISLPETLTTIEDDAFRGSLRLTSITVPQSVASVGVRAFADCTSLTGAELRNTVVSDQMFRNCTALTHIDLPETITRIGSNAFTESGLIQVTVPASVTTVGNGAFFNCPQLQSATIGSSNVSPSMFSSCPSLTAVHILGTTASIGNYAFGKCTALTDVTIDHGASTIGEEAFSGCTSLREIALPGSLKVITWTIFKDCTALETVRFGEGTQQIQTAFGGCSALRSVYIPASVTAITSGTFSTCPSLSNLELSSDNATYSLVGGVLFNKAGNELVGYPGGLGEQYDVPQGTTKIGQSAFLGCSRLQWVTVPESVTEIADRAFSGSGIRHIDLKARITRVDQFTFAGCAQLEEIDLPSTVRSIGWSAFENCSSLKRITMPPALSSMETSVFSRCKSLKSIELPAAMTSVPSWTFLNCDSLEQVVIPAKVKYISGSAFYFCSRLTTIVCQNPVPPQLEDVSGGAFYYTPRDTLRVPRASIEAYRANHEFKKFKHILPLVGDCDVTCNGTVDIGDVNRLITEMLKPEADETCDVDGNGTIDVADVSLVVNAMLSR